MEAIYLPDRDHPNCHPLTLTRPLAECPVANRPWRQLAIAELEDAGLEVVAAAAGLALYVQDNAWLARRDLEQIARIEGAAAIWSPARDLLAFVSDSPEPSPDAEDFTARDSFAVEYPWDLLKLHEIALKRITANDIRGQLSPHAHIDGVLHLGEGSIVLPGVYCEGVVLIGRNCKIGPNCYFRGPVAVGDNCHVGQAVELKCTVLMNHVAAGHLSYLGDSIIGERTNIGAGTITANFRHDGTNHRSMVRGELVDTGRRKFGTIMGDQVHTGIHTSIYPGRKFWPHASTRPGDVVQYDIVV